VYEITCEFIEQEYYPIMLTDLTNMKKGRVLITGHTGFKGSWLTLLLLELGIEPVGLSLNNMGEDSLYYKIGVGSQIEEYFVDIRNYDHLSASFSRIKPTHIFHLAAQSLVLTSHEEARYTFEVNAQGTWNILDAASKNPRTETVVCATTDKVYRPTGMRKYSETDPLGGVDPYSHSKVAAEIAIESWRPTFKSEGKQLVSVRAGNVIGGGDQAKNRIMSDFANGMKNKSKLEIRNPNATRPWQHALSPLYGYLLAMNKNGNAYHPAYNFGPDERSLSVKELLEIANSGLAQNQVDVVFGESTILETQHLDLDSSLSKRDLEWLPVFNQSQSILMTVAWWEAVLNGQLSSYEACKQDVRSFLESIQ
jgi:CDP-glucose 4,6-dehydratase